MIFLSQIITFFTAWICPKTLQTWSIRHTWRKCHNLLSSSISTIRRRYNQGKCILPYTSHILCCAFKNLISERSLNSAESRDIGHAHFCLRFFVEIYKISQTYVFELLPGHFTDLHQTLHTASLDSPDKKIFWILIFQTILKLLNNNFLQISFQTGSVAYLHIGVSKWHETQVTTSPWAPVALCRVWGNDH